MRLYGFVIFKILATLEGLIIAITPIFFISIASIPIL
jgi:hypothetical protein